MPDTYKNGVKVPVTSNANFGAAIVGAAVSGHAGFVSTDNAKTFAILWEQGSDWSIETGCEYTHSSTAIGRGNVEVSSTGARLALTTSATATVVAPASFFNRVEEAVESFGVACSDETTALTTGAAKATFRMPYAFTLTGVRASVNTAPTGANLVVDINDGGVSILSTKLSIDATEKTSVTAATPAVISNSALASDDEITIDIDQIGSTVAGAGLKVWLIGRRA